MKGQITRGTRWSYLDAKDSTKQKRAAKRARRARKKR